MKGKKTIQKLLCVLLIMTLTIPLVAISSFATDSERSLILSTTRWIKNGNGEFDEKKAYTIFLGDENNPINNKPIYQIISVDNQMNKNGTNYYCLNATIGNTWVNNSVGTKVDYDKSYDLSKSKSVLIQEMNGKQEASDVINSEYYGSVLWILDHMYVKGGLTKIEVLNNAGILYGSHPMYPDTNTWYYEPDESLLNWRQTSFGYTNGYYIMDNGQKKDIILEDEEVEAVQQAAIWYFTNFKSKNQTNFNVYTNKDQALLASWFGFEESNDAIKKIKKEQAAILCNYFIDEAEKNKEYTSTSNGEIKIQYAESTEDKVIKVGNNYRIGPIVATETGNAKITTSSLTITPSTGAKVTDANGTEKSFKANENFYVTIPKASVENEINIAISGNKTETKKLLWTKNDDIEQPVVEVEKKKNPLNANLQVSISKEFDLALRKIITEVDGKSTIKNEDGLDANRIDNNRNININKSTIPDTATYKHRKDPVVVKHGSKVTYEIRIFNEGEIAGYASKIVDQLPSGLKSTLKTGDEITSSNGNRYKVDYSEEYNKLEFTIKDIDNAIAISAYDGTTLSFDKIKVEATVEENATTDGITKKYLTNIAYIAGEFNTEKKQEVIQDRNGNESKPSVSPSKNKTDLNSENANSYKGADSNKSVYSDTNNSEYYQGQEDDDDFEKVVILPQSIDLALRKFITKVSTSGNFEDTATTKEYNRAPTPDTAKLSSGAATTATYIHTKEPVYLEAGNYVLYTIRAYNEGEIPAYASVITDHLPENLDFLVDSTNEYIKSINDKWTYDPSTRTVTTNKAGNSDGKPVPENATTKLEAFNGKGSKLKHVDVQIICQVNSKTVANKKLTNIAEISEYKDETGTVITKDRDSIPGKLKYPENPETYKDDEINKEYVPGQEDDDDFEKVVVIEKKVDLALTKFITAVSKDDKIEDGEYLTPNKKIGSKTNEYIRATVADTTGLKNGTSTNATYSARKDIEPLAVEKNSYILYNIRVYNEGEVPVYAGEITDYLPENLEFVKGEFNKQYGWTDNGQTVKTTYLSSKNGTDKLLAAFDKENDNGKGSGMDYKDLPILCKVSDKAESGKKMVNTAEITKYEDEKGKDLPKDVDSEPNNKENKNVEERDQDDDDYEVVIIKNFDLALRKFITNIQGKDITSRIPKVNYKNGKITYTHPKDVVKVGVGNVVTYTLRVFNEGDIAGFAEQISDDIPEYLEFLPENATNRKYRWVMYDKDGKSTTKVKNAVKIVTDYTSKAYGETLMKSNSSLKKNPNLLEAFNKNGKISENNPDFVDVQVAFKVKDPNSNKTVITNKAQISEDADENGNPIDDIDSVPDKWNDGEDDQDYENVSVEYFDLSLLKYVTKAIVTENGKTKITKTGNNGSKKDITPKVEIHRKKINQTIVKFEYVIKVTNEGDIEGYATEITDYVPKGLKFYKEDNKGWKDEGNNVISTELLKNTLLKPGQSATVKVVLRWVNGENNLSLKINTAEISKDKNEKGIPDRDSTPDNKKPGEDDIDDAPVLLTISTGAVENTIKYVSGALVILTTIGLGLLIIKKYVL